MKKALLVITVVAVSWVSSASADVRQNDVRTDDVRANDVRANDVRANDVRQVLTPNPWKTI